MKAIKQYNELTEKIKKYLPLKALPVRELVNVYRNNGKDITLKTELIIKEVHNSGNLSGIMCVIKVDKNVFACGLTHLIFSPKIPLYKEIIKYQKNREKRMRKINAI
ncbi:MAG: hypothetical protein ACK504_03600 [Bacteroidota bacterium]|jgi:hypothetical protein